MADIRLVRVDFRLMHGQVIAAWMNQVDGNAIMIINDQLAGDSFMKNVYKMVMYFLLILYMQKKIKFILQNLKNCLHPATL